MCPVLGRFAWSSATLLAAPICGERREMTKRINLLLFGFGLI
jgi:hypothetical protein